MIQGQKLLSDEYCLILSKIGFLTREKERELVAEMLAGRTQVKNKDGEYVYRYTRSSAEARQILVESQLKWVVTIAKRYNGQSIDLDDLVQAGNYGLLKSLDKYDGSTRLTTYSHLLIKAEVVKELRNHRTAIRVPSPTLQNYYKNPEKFKKLSHETQMIVGGHIKQIQELENFEVLDTEFSDEIEADYLEHRLKLLAEALEKLDKKVQKIVKDRSEGKILQEIANDLGCTIENIRQREAKGLDQLKKLMEDLSKEGSAA